MQTEFTSEALIARAAFLEKQIETWKGNPEYANTLRMEAWALRFAAVAPAAMKEACDLLAERKYGCSARSPGHNARLVLESTLKSPITTGQAEATS